MFSLPPAARAIRQATSSGMLDDVVHGEISLE
jgi:hypothetical protein